MKPLLITLLTFFLQVLAAQNLALCVRDSRGAVPYAYVSINGQMQTATDSVGRCEIRLSKLSSGDTLSAYYVGYSPAYTIFSDSIRRAGICEIVFDNSAYNLAVGEVEVSGNIERFFAKKVATTYSVWNGVATGTLNAKIRPYVGAQEYRVIGSFSCENKISGKGMEMEEFGYFHLPCKITTKSDTSFVGRQLDGAMHTLLGYGFINTARVSSAYVRRYWRKNADLKLEYLGKEDGVLTFTAVHNAWLKSKRGKIIRRSGYPIHQIIRVDESSRDINSADYYFVVENYPDYKVEYKMHVEFAKGHKGKLGFRMLMPSLISYKVAVNGQQIYDITIDNIIFVLKR